MSSSLVVPGVRLPPRRSRRVRVSSCWSSMTLSIRLMISLPERDKRKRPGGSDARGQERHRSCMSHDAGPCCSRSAYEPLGSLSKRSRARRRLCAVQSTPLRNCARCGRGDGPNFCRHQQHTGAPNNSANQTAGSYRKWSSGSDTHQDAACRRQTISARQSKRSESTVI